MSKIQRTVDFLCKFDGSTRGGCATFTAGRKLVALGQKNFMTEKFTFGGTNIFVDFSSTIIIVRRKSQ